MTKCRYIYFCIFPHPDNAKIKDHTCACVWSRGRCVSPLSTPKEERGAKKFSVTVLKYCYFLSQGTFAIYGLWRLNQPLQHFKATYPIYKTYTDLSGTQKMWSNEFKIVVMIQSLKQGNSFYERPIKCATYSIQLPTK